MSMKYDFLINILKSGNSKFHLTTYFVSILSSFIYILYLPSFAQDNLGNHPLSDFPPTSYILSNKSHSFFTVNPFKLIPYGPILVDINNLVTIHGSVIVPAINLEGQPSIP